MRQCGSVGVVSAVRHGSFCPFPWRSLESTSRREAAALRDAYRWAKSHVRLAPFARAVQELVGAKVELLVLRARPLSDARVPDGGVGFVVGRADESAAAGVLVEVEAALAAAVVARAIRRTPPIISSSAAKVSADIAGGLAAVVMAAVRRAHQGEALRVYSAGPASELEADFARVDPDLVAVTLTVLLADDAFSARVVMSRHLAFVEQPPAWTAGVLSALGATPLSIPIVACATLATAADVGALRPGDAFLPGTWPLWREGGEAGGNMAGWVGPVSLSAPCSELGVRASLGEAGRLVLGGEVHPLCLAEADMAEPNERDALVTAVGEVPVVVRVEIGEARMAARDWASLCRGDVIALGKRVGEHDVHRVGGVPVARGDLVEIDGEIGVRLAERLTDEQTTP
jgi:flagellar motor switch/type III secretory pathway protein FliN